MSKYKNDKCRKPLVLKDEKPVIYQLFPRIFTNNNPTNKPWGKIEENGSGKFSDINVETLRSLRDLGVTALWLTGVIEHATGSAYPQAGIPADNMNVVKGEAGSPYAIKDYYDVDPALAEDAEKRMGEFEQCVDRIHSEGLKVLIDFVPNHTARKYHSDVAPAGVEDFGSADRTDYYFSPDNNYYYIPDEKFSPDFPIDSYPGEEAYYEFPAKATGNDCFSSHCSKNDWYETVKLNYGHDYGDNSDHFDPIPDTWRKMLDILLFWASKGVDGFRCDMVFMVPLSFWHWVIPLVKKQFPDIVFIGEIYDVNQYRPFLDYGCFDYLYDKVNLYDTLVSIERFGNSAANLTGCWQTIDGIGDRMLNFLENHDEVRFGSREYSAEPINVIPSLVASALISRGPFMIYYGQELGESATENEGFAGDNNRSTIFDYWSYDKLRRWWNNGSPSEARLTEYERKLRNIYGKVLRLCNGSDAISKGGFFDLTYANLDNMQYDSHFIFSFLRYYKNEVYLIVSNFSLEEKTVLLNIPGHSFECVGIESGEYVGVNMLDNREYSFSLAPDKAIELHIGKKNALVLKLEKKERILRPLLPQ